MYIALKFNPKELPYATIPHFPHKPKYQEECRAKK